jgi:hypothetical protein
MMMGGQLPSFGQQQQPMMPSFANPQQTQQHGGGGFNPLMMLSPFAGMMAHDPKLGLSMISPAFGIANLLGAFK